MKKYHKKRMIKLFICNERKKKHNLYAIKEMITGILYVYNVVD